MLTSIQGIYHNGKIELIEKPNNVLDNTQVIVTFLESGQIDLRKRGMDQKQVAELRAAFATFAPEWDSPEMDVYNNYDAANSTRLCANNGVSQISEILQRNDGSRSH